MNIYPSTTVRPYVYMGIDLITREFYIGYREANTKPSHIDLFEYRTSSDPIKLRFDQMIWSILAEFEIGNDAYDFEQLSIFENWDNPLLLNQHCSYGHDRFKITEDGKNYLRKINIGKKWFNDGQKEIHSHSCPGGFILGRLHNCYPVNTGSNTKDKLWFNNGINEVMSFSCPEGFISGRIPCSEEYKSNMSSIMKEKAHARGKHWFTNGKESILTFECPPGFWRGYSNVIVGKRWFSNDTESIFAFSCPEGFSPGRKFRTKNKS